MLLQFFFLKQRFQETSASQPAAQALNVLPRDRLQDDLVRVLVNFDMNARSVLHSKLSPNCHRDCDLAFACDGGVHYSGIVNGIWWKEQWAVAVSRRVLNRE